MPTINSSNTENISDFRDMGVYLYFFGLISYLCFTMILNSTYSIVLNQAMQSILKIIPLFFLCFSIILKNTFSKQCPLLLFIVCLLCSLISYKQSGSIALLVIVLIIFSSQDININAIARCFQYTVIITSICIICSSLANIIPNVYRPDMYGLLHYDLGFGYGSQIGYYLEALLICQLVKQRGKITYVQAAGFGTAALLYFILWRFSSQTIVIVLMLLCALTIHNIRSSKIIDSINIMLFPCIGFGYLFFNYFYTSNIPWMDKLNTLLTWRLGLGYNALHNQGLSIFGAKISFSGFGVGSNTALFNAGGRATITGLGSYDYIDSSYLLTPMLFGIVSFGMLLAAYSLLLFTLSRLQYSALTIVLILVGIQCCINPILYQINYNPFIIFLLPLTQEYMQRKSNV